MKGAYNGALCRVSEHVAVLERCRKLRVGDYCVIFRIEKTIVKIIVVAHRSFIYHDG
ncbi:MAG: type II toxin-antitoxin system RelE/ParE family toxin [Parcubacteria group bacterium]|nr:type II toxin-antitoxin system RelE/ParE family toxin [Parcubacteria group bacterium]